MTQLKRVFNLFEQRYGVKTSSTSFTIIEIKEGWESQVEKDYVLMEKYAF